MKPSGITLTALIFGLLAGTAQAADTVRLTSLEWPPYTGEKLAEQGASMAVAREAFEAMGYELEVEFLPWQRAVDKAMNDPEIAGYFPEYYAESLEENFIFSESMGSGPLGFAEQAGNPVNWNSLEDLSDKTIGTVSGYVNTEKFDAMAENGELTVEPVTDDATNLRKVAGGRIPLAVIDQNVMEYLLSDELSNLSGDIQFNDKLLEDKDLYIAFTKSEKGREMAEIFDKGLEKIDQDAIMKETFEKIME